MSKLYLFWMTAMHIQDVATPTIHAGKAVFFQLGEHITIPLAYISRWEHYHELNQICFHLFVRGNDEKSRSQRMHIYVTLLKQMTPVHLLATFAKVCAEILAAASDAMLSLDDSTSQSVLRVTNSMFLSISSSLVSWALLFVWEYCFFSLSCWFRNLDRKVGSYRLLRIWISIYWFCI